MSSVKIIIAGVSGHMGKAAYDALSQPLSVGVSEAPDFKIVGAVARQAAGSKLPCGLKIAASLQEALRFAPEPADIVLDLTSPENVFEHAKLAIASGARPLIGATGLTQDEQATLHAQLIDKSLPGAMIPNFSLGAVLLMQFAAQASRYFDAAEIIELHHPGKHDAPSGTALLTAQKMADVRERFNPHSRRAETLPGARGGVYQAMPDASHDASSEASDSKASNIAIHSLRLPGLVAHQEVIFGGLGQTLTIRHDSLNRQSFMPGVILAARWLMATDAPPGLTIGLDAMLPS
ncbi:MAG: 4-hydroxy-tetrahydrodipicolinate reductase [Vampirovibrionales bacterium]|nr:4-hydroxy-tetrahydrodipicolinate reductase [Vampirovibrionales bacterium]